MDKLVGVEIGGTKQQIAVGTARGEILDRRTVRLGDKTSAGDILMWLEDNIRKIMDRWEIGGIGVGFGGPLELRRGRVLCSLHNRDHPLPVTDVFPSGAGMDGFQAEGVV